MRRTRKKPIWEYRIYFTVIFIFSLPGALLTCMKSLVKGKLKKICLVRHGQMPKQSRP